MFQEEVATELSRLTGMKRAEILPLLEKPRFSNLGDWAFPCFDLAKQQKKNPVVIAQELVQKMALPLKGIERVQPLGPYINFYVDKGSLGELIIGRILRQKDNHGFLE